MSKSRGELTLVATTEHEVTYQEICSLVSRHASTMTPLEILAVAANMVGKLIAMQDQRTITAEKAMVVVSRNIEIGNQQALDVLSKQQAGSA